uniref:HD domain-containing protein n=1 Tax=Candidatus Electronema sp. TaxID=2698783 RepID=UPI004056CC9E
MPDFKNLLSVARSYLQDVDLSPLERAYAFACELHKDQLHLSGELYVRHILDVATTIASMKLDVVTITSGLLHGAIRHGQASQEELAAQFGPEVANIVSGATRITSVRYDSSLTHQAENIRRLFLAMGSDIRVLLVRLADRLHDMLGLHNADEERRRQLARETMDLYAPLASRLGIDWMKRQLEDLSFQHLFPAEHESLIKHIDSTIG